MDQSCDINEHKGICEENIFSNIYVSTAEHLRNYIYYKCGLLDVAEDITQLTFLKMWERCREIILGKARSYAFTVANRLFLGQVKSNKVALKFLKEKISNVNNDDPEGMLISDELRIKIETSISELPEGQREVFLLNRIDKMTYREIAVTLNVSETAVEKRMSKALLKLRDKIEEFKQYNI